MENAQGKNGIAAGRYEAIFCIFMAALAYLWRDNPSLIYPQILYLLAALMALNLGAGLSLRFWPEAQWVSALFIAANCGVVTAIVAYSGGAQSNLWVLYLLPIYTACLLLGGAEVFWVAVGAAAFNAVFLISEASARDGAALFELMVKSGVLIFASAITWRLAQKDKITRTKLERERREVKGLLHQVRDQQERLEEKAPLAELGLLSSGLAHDLASTFMVILSFAEIAGKSSSAAGAEDIRDDLEHIRRSALLGTNLVASLSRRGDDPAGRCDLREALRSTVSLLRPMFLSRRVRAEIADGLGEMIAAVPRTEAQRVLLNLLSNAAKAMKNGGEIRVAMEEAEAPETGSSVIRLVVEDTGPGIAPEILPRLFSPYATTRAAEGGTGMGLYICRRIVGRRGGTIAAGNGETGGARFTVTLPAAERAQTAPARERVA